MTPADITTLQAFWKHAKFEAKSAAEYDRTDNALRSAVRRAQAGLSGAGQMLNEASDGVHDFLKAHGMSVLVVSALRSRRELNQFSRSRPARLPRG